MTYGTIGIHFLFLLSRPPPPKVLPAAFEALLAASEALLAASEALLAASEALLAASEALPDASEALPDPSEALPATLYPSLPLSPFQYHHLSFQLPSLFQLPQ